MTREKIVLYLSAVLLLAVLLRIPSLLVGFANIDENEYALAGAIINQGGIPYKDFLIYQPPVIYYLYALTFRLVPAAEMVGGMWWVHVFLLGIVAATCAAVYFTGRRAFASAVPALFAALFYAVFSTTFLPQDMLAANIELVMVLPMALSVYFLLKGEQKLFYFLLSGVFLGLAVLTKYQGGILLVAFAAHLFLVRPWKKGLLPMSLILLGSAAMGGGWVYYLYRHGALPDAIRCFLYILDYAKGPPQSDFVYVALKLILRTFMIAASGFALWYFALRSLFSHGREWWNGRRPEMLVVLWFLFSFVPVVTGGRMYFHYFILLFPPLCLLAGLGVSAFFNRLKQMPFEKGAWRLAFFILAVFVPITGFTAYATYKPFRPKHKDYWIYAVDYIRDRTKPSDPIFVWGYCPQIYTVSNRPPATRFTTADYLTGRSPKTAGLEYDPKTPNPPSVWTKLKRDFITPREVIDYDTSDNVFPGAWDLLLDDFKKNPPAVIVDTSPSNYRLYGRYPMSAFPRLRDYVEKHYVFEASIRGMDIYRRKK